MEILGGEPVLRAIVEDFYGRVFDDVMIGFMFKGRDRARLIELEVQFTARAFGENVAYEGRGMRHAHASLPILIGHFQRRYQILVETLADHDVHPDVRDAWLGHSRALQRAILQPERRGVDCQTPLEAGVGAGRPAGVDGDPPQGT
jgi:hemoglobin